MIFMPIDEKNLNEIFNIKAKLFLSKMTSGQFYSIDELFELILGKRLDEEGLF
jgi:hypothetical protein